MLRKIMSSSATMAVATIVAAGPALSADKPFHKGKRITFLGKSGRWREQYGGMYFSQSYRALYPG